ncbi:MAG: tetratricopeptide repeat protein, partial [Thermoanaerobaculia bacterium]|nr:tetratricopeptide repeat protein [Thermoanaerobaculia bacterium]
ALRDRPQRWLHAGPKAQTIDLQDWFIPQLYQAGEDPALVPEATLPVLEVRPAPADPEANLHNFPPSPLYSFQGRAFELLQVERAFESSPAVLVSGGGGMGKTALAREVAHWLLRLGRFEAAVFVSFEQTPSVQRVVQEFGRALEGSSFSSRLAEDQYETVVALFRSRRVLLVWDNFESTLPQFQPGEEGSLLVFSPVERQELAKLYHRLVQGEPAGRLLVTCRPDATGLDSIAVLPLEGLAREDSLTLVQAIAEERGIDLERPGYEREAMEKLLDLLGDHPLALSLVSPHLKELKPAEICKDFAALFERFKDETAVEARNRSLLASLAFSSSRLSPATREALPWLAWFQGGAFEASVLTFTQLSAGAWAATRAELEGTALLRVEEIEMFTNPFIRFHPTLPYAARRQEVGDVEAAEQRFVAVYLRVSQEVAAALEGRGAAAGMVLMAREEVNFRSALEITFRRGERQPGIELADTLRLYLQRAARLHERDALVDWVGAQMPEGERLDGSTCTSIRQQALSLMARGRTAEAVAMMQQLIVRLETEDLAGGVEAALELGTSYRNLGVVFLTANRPDLAVEKSLRAIAILQKELGESGQTNLAAALSDLANAFLALGKLDEALMAAEQALAIVGELGRRRDVAYGINQCGTILAAKQRLVEAEARHQEAFELARRIGDLDLQGTALLHQGILNRQRGNPARAAEFYEQAMTLFQQAGDMASEMASCNSLASAEAEGGQLEVAGAWYGRARELATKLGDQYHLGVVAQNVGLLYQTRAEQATDAESRATWLLRALVSIEESSAICLESNDRVGAASSYFQLGVLHEMLGDLDLAERKSRQALEIWEPLDHPEVWRGYAHFAKIAEARGDGAAAAEWTAKRDAKLAELKQRRGG